MPDEYTPPTNLATPNDEDEGTPQEPTKRFPWSKPAVQTKPTAKVRRELRSAHRRTSGA